MNLVKYIAVSLTAFNLFACTDSFLEEKMVSTITQDYFETEIGLEQLIVGTYDALRVTKQYQQGPYCFFAAVDNMTCKNANMALYSASMWQSNGKYTAQMADGLAGEFTSNQLLGFYPCINNCNRAINSIRSGKAQGKFASDAVYAAQSLSEVLFNRAYCIYMLNTLFGDVYVPLEHTISLPNNYNYRRETSANLYSLMISDLRYAFENLPTATELGTNNLGRATKGAAAHFLSKLYLHRAQGSKYGTAEYGRKENGTIDNTNEKSYLGMLYKGQGIADLDSCIYYTNYVIDQDGYYALEPDYAKMFEHKLDDYSNENSREFILSCVFGTPANSGDNGRYGNRLNAFLSTKYVNAAWGIPKYTWEYGGKDDVMAVTNDFGLDLFTNKFADSRYQKSFILEFTTALNGSDNSSTPAVDKDYYAYNDPNNATYTWTQNMANYFNQNILPSYKRQSWKGRKAIAGEHKMGTQDLAFAYVENTKETALEMKIALAQPYVVFARWIKDDNKYYYRPTIKSDGSSYSYNSGEYMGLDKVQTPGSPVTGKYVDPNRNSYDSYYSSRDVPLFRLAETYLIRATAYGLKGDFALAIDDINKIRERAAFKAGESRAEVLARLQPGHEDLIKEEQQWPYTVITDMTSAMRIDESYWDGGSKYSLAEQYPPTAVSVDDRFVNFILNEIAREMNSEFIYYEWLHHSGWQADRIIYHDQTGSDMQGLWDSSDNIVSGNGPTGNGLGNFKPWFTLKPFRQNIIDLLTDENGVLLTGEGKKAYQNYGY